ncbi:sugar ABC transporter ATPase [Pseudomonas sp. TCU-HL1]|uniref:sugar ABC transporter ATPase n=1 Tax=Pseudomonas sp. TCU-HL1 TaxID=1856685 RepID=UPI00083DF2FA|nr:sugar ABC transporter ATPase [Pseudomonas sp. TCU-HL1]AOE83756.1 sugar ABC transporter ATPase [Pseudomonas sp. TCU-HL1]
MESSQLIIVPQVSSVPGHQALAGRMLRWLAQREVVEPLPSTCGLRGNRMAYAIAPGARNVVEHPDRLPFGLPVRGLELVDKRCIYTPTRNFLNEAGCPECRKEVGEPLFESLEDWWPGRTDNFSCPECGFEDDINGFLFLQPCGFSNLGFIFNGWGETAFTRAFLDAFAERLGFAVRQVRTDG